MILVFNQFPIKLGVTSTINPVNTRAASASTEVTNVIEWIIQVDC